MNFRTELHPKPADFKLNQASRIVTVGSCFSDVIGNQLEKYKVETLTNPFGTLFNPLSACKLLQICAGADVELADSFVENNGRWYSYDFHSSFSAETEEELYELLDEAIVKTRRFLKKADVLILTLGTANIFRLNITGETVANCHKLPAANFSRETLLPEEIITSIAETHSLLRELNPNLKLVLTVSPVRHLKDTLELNSVSKSVLRLATHFLTQNLPDIAYFPSYELLIDDLRDYRFYKEDMLHPTTLAENYIWEKFTGAYFDESFRSFTTEWDTVLRAKSHKPFHPESALHQAFIQNMLQKLQSLQDKVNVAEEIAFFESQVVVLPEPKEEEEEELEEAAAEEETIPGYFSEEIEEAEAEEVAETSLQVAEPATAEQLEQKKRKKKPRRKKKKHVAQTEEVSLPEVGTAVVTEAPEVFELPSEPAAELAEILADPEHKIEHYGETLSENPVVKKQLSRSAKRRESRKKKKALTALENGKMPQVAEEISAPSVEEIVPAPTLGTENATVSAENFPEFQRGAVAEENIAALANENAMLSVQKTASEDKSKKQKGGRKKKNAFPDLYSAEVQPEAIATITITKAESDLTKTPARTSDNTISIAQEPEAVAQKPEKVKKGRKPKKAQLFAEPETAKPITETIAVPFMPAADLDEAEVIAVPFLPVSELDEAETTVKKPAKRGRAAKPKAVNPEVSLNAESVAEEAINKPVKPARKPAAPRSKPTAPKAPRKKKTTPES